MHRAGRRIAGLCATTALASAFVAGDANAAKPTANSNAKQCKNGGWQVYETTAGVTFASEKECVSAVAKGATLVRISEARCAALGGTYARGTDNVIWTCASVPLPGVEQYFAYDAELKLLCLADGGAGLVSTGEFEDLEGPGVGRFECGV